MTRKKLNGVGGSRQEPVNPGTLSPRKEVKEYRDEIHRDWDLAKMRRTSKSSIEEMQTCEQMWLFHRGMNLRPDFEDSVAANTGSAVHHILEHSKHFSEYDSSDFGKWEELYNEAIKLFPIAIGPQFVVRGLCSIYSEYMKNSGRIPLLYEVAVGDIETDSESLDRSIGYIDLIERDKNWNWFIIDIKTSSAGYTKEKEKIAGLNRDLQLCNYAQPKHILQVAKAAEKEGITLDPAKFAGVAHRVGVKATKADYPKTDHMEYESWFAAKGGKLIWQEFFVPANKLDFEHANRVFNYSKARAIELSEGAAVLPLASTEKCFNQFFKPCPYFSRCFGHTVDEAIGASSVKYFSGNLPEIEVSRTTPVQEPVTPVEATPGPVSQETRPAKKAPPKKRQPKSKKETEAPAAVVGVIINEDDFE